MRFLKCMQRQDEELDNSKQIDKEIRSWIKHYNDSIKLLLLGTGESGKTTIIKQMKILHIEGFTKSERDEKAKHIRHNIHESIHDIVINMRQLGIQLYDANKTHSVNYILKYGLKGPDIYDEVYYDHVRSLWKDPGVLECFRRSNEYQLIDSAEYFLNRIELISRCDYEPTNNDILRCRQKTTGIQKIEFKVKVPKSMHGGVQEFWMFDVGGQRGERKKWIQVFEGIHAIWFIVASSDFDTNLREDTRQNRLQESLELFEDVWHSRFLLDAGLIVFLNKQDILEYKVNNKRKCIGDYFTDYNQFRCQTEYINMDEYNKTRIFIKNMFINITKKIQRSRQHLPINTPGIMLEASRPRECYYHYTTATDTNNIDTVFKDVHQIILKHILNNYGLL